METDRTELLKQQKIAKLVLMIRNDMHDLFKLNQLKSSLVEQ